WGRSAQRPAPFSYGRYQFHEFGRRCNRKGPQAAVEGSRLGNRFRQPSATRSLARQKRRPLAKSRDLDHHGTREWQIRRLGFFRRESPAELSLPFELQGCEIPQREA